MRDVEVRERPTAPSASSEIKELIKPRNVITYCISLPESPRRKAFAASAAENGLSFEFFDAICIDDLRKGTSVEGCAVDLTDLGWTNHERRDPRRRSAPLLFTEIGCAYSHIKCWQRARQLNADFVVIFEDDAIIKRHPEHNVWPQDADIIYLGDRMPRNKRGEAAGYGCGTDAYTLTRTGISKCLEIFRVLYMPIDLQLIAHQKAQFAHGHGLTKYRRKISNDLYLQAYVASHSVASYRTKASSQLS
jgi:GR25 family glycosyltransferase involved in LPS biosynthesis